MQEMVNSISDIIEDFKFLSNWEDRYTYIIDIGKTLEPLKATELIDANKVEGCTSQVWLIHSRKTDGSIEFRATSDAVIVRGLIAIILRIYSGRKPEEILAMEPKTVFEQLELAEHLSPSRSNGFFSIVTRIKSIAKSGR